MSHSSCVLLIMLLACFAAGAQPMLPPPQPQSPSQPSAQAAPPPPVGRMYAIHARGAVPEQPHMDEKLKPIAPLLEALPFTSFDALSIEEQELPWGGETLLPINAVYAMHVTALGLDEEGTTALRARVEMLQDGDYVNALDTMAHAVRNQALVFRGLPLGADELVVVLLVGMPSEEGADGSPAPEAEPEPGEEQPEPETGDQEQSEDRERDAEQADQQESETQEDMREEGEAPEGVENMDALLESLEETDRREQMEERRRRDRIDIKGDWW